MPNTMLRIKMQWSGFQGAPGYSNFYFRDWTSEASWTPTQAQVDASAAAVTTFAQSITSQLAPGVSLQVSSDAELLMDDTGDLVDVFSAAAQAAKTSSATAGVSYSGPTGAVINWRTKIVRKNRRVKGRTFLVPCNRDAYEGNGTLSSGAITQFSNAANTLVTGTGYPDLGVWARPSKVIDPATGKQQKDPVTGKGVTLPDGLWALASSATVPDLAAVLRSRRD